MKSCDSLIILKHLKPKSYQNEIFTLKGQTTGTERKTKFVYMFCSYIRSVTKLVYVLCVYVCVCWANTVSSELN